MSGIAFTTDSTVYESFPTDADFSAGRGRAVLATATDMDYATTDQDSATGILPANVKDWSSEPNRTGLAVQSVVVFGPCAARAGGTITAVGPQTGGVKVEVTTARLVTANTGEECVGYAMETAADGEFFRMFVQRYTLP